MAKRRKAYDNMYTRQMEEAVFDQVGYDAKKEEEKAKIIAENKLQRKNIQGIFVLIGLFLLGGIGYAINLDPDNSGPAAMCFAIFLIVSALIFLFKRP